MRQAFLLDMKRVVQILRLKKATGSVKKKIMLSWSYPLNVLNPRMDILYTMSERLFIQRKTYDIQVSGYQHNQIQLLG